MVSEFLALVALTGMAGLIGFAVALMLRRDAPTQTPPPAAERNLTDSFMLETLNSRLGRLESGSHISININMPQVRYATGAPERQQLPDVRTPLYLPAAQTRHSLPDSKVQVIDWSVSDEYATIR